MAELAPAGPEGEPDRGTDRAAAAAESADLLGFLEGPAAGSAEVGPDATGPAGSGGLDLEGLAASIARVLGGETVRGLLEAPLGSAHADPRFDPSAGDVLDAREELMGAGEHDVPAAGRLALAIGPTEDFGRLGGRLARALERDSRVALLGHGALPGVAAAITDGLARDGIGAGRLRAFEGRQLGRLRRAAGLPGVAIDVSDFDAPGGDRLARLLRLRELAGAEGSPPAGAEGGSSAGTARVVARPRPGRRILVGLEAPASAGRALGAEDLAEAAEQVVEEAFGRPALGGFASDAVTQVWVAPRLLSRFTACLLEVLDDVDGDPWFLPPPMFAEGEGAGVLRDVATGRRLGLDGGATLIHERADAQGRPCGSVFTNVEPRMKLGGALSAPGTLALLRALEAPTAEAGSGA